MGVKSTILMTRSELTDYVAVSEELAAKDSRRWL